MIPIIARRLMLEEKLRVFAGTNMFGPDLTSKGYKLVDSMPTHHPRVGNLFDVKIIEAAYVALERSE